MAGKKQPKGKHASVEARNSRQRNMTDGLASIVAIMMRDRRFRDVRMADLEWLVLPPIMAGQWKLAQGTMTPGKGTDPKEGGRAFPVAAALWASVSAEVDARLTKDLDKPMMLKPAEWTSGDIIWLIAVPGQPAYVKELLQHLHTTTFKGKQVKIRTADRAGKPTTRTLDALLGKS
jgi:cytolysin-activating lysine-acyltransferase